MSGTDFSWPGPYTPSMATQTMPEVAFDAQVQALGLRLGWMKAHSCPCSQGGRVTGTPDPSCITCRGRGVYWESPLEFLGYYTYMHTSSAPDESGAKTSVDFGTVERAEPTLTIPKNGLLNEATVWAQAAQFDAYLEYDAVTRYNIVLQQQEGEQMVLPYQDELTIIDVTTWNTMTKSVVALTPDQYSMTNGVLSCVGFPDGSAFTVEFTSIPVMVAYRNAGGMPHTRPFAQGSTGIPRRFHLVAMDIWLRSSAGGDGPNAAAALAPVDLRG